MAGAAGGDLDFAIPEREISRPLNDLGHPIPGAAGLPGNERGLYPGRVAQVGCVNRYMQSSRATYADNVRLKPFVRMAGILSGPAGWRLPGNIARRRKETRGKSQFEPPAPPPLDAAPAAHRGPWTPHRCLRQHVGSADPWRPDLTTLRTVGNTGPRPLWRVGFVRRVFTPVHTTPADGRPRLTHQASTTPPASASGSMGSFGSSHAAGFTTQPFVAKRLTRPLTDLRWVRSSSFAHRTGDARHVPTISHGQRTTDHGQ